MRIDANHGGKPQYHPNSYSTTMNSSMTKRRAPGFDPAVAEAPFQVANNVMSRHSYWKHEGDPCEYNQVRELYQVGLQVLDCRCKGWCADLLDN